MNKIIKCSLLCLLFFGLVFARETYRSHVRQLGGRLHEDASDISRHPQDALRDMDAAFHQLDVLDMISPVILESSPWAAYHAHKILGIEEARISIYLQVSQLEEDAEIAHNNNPQVDLSGFISQYRSKMHEYSSLVDEVNNGLEGAPVPDEIYDALSVLEK